MIMLVHILSIVRSENAFRDGILKEVCHWSSPVKAETGTEAYDTQDLCRDS